MDTGIYVEFPQTNVSYQIFKREDEFDETDGGTFALILFFDVIFASLLYLLGIKLLSNKTNNQEDGNNNQRNNNNNNGFSLYVGRDDDILPSYQDALDTTQIVLDNNDNNNTSSTISNANDEDALLPDYSSVNDDANNNSDNEFNESELPTYQEAVDTSTVHN